jgi:hypothetical protein
MAANYIIRGSTVHVGSDLDVTVKNHLPVGTYEICFSEMEGFYLKKIPDFVMPRKLYGKTAFRADRFLQTFADRPGVTGVLLTGLKGSGKSLEMKQTATAAALRDIATIVVSSPYKGTQFNNFIASIDDACLVLFDEFEKVYDWDAQEELLTLLDGTVTTKKLVIFTSNDRYRINEHMVNRPGRIFYSIEYVGLEADFIREYCEENLNDKSQIESVLTLAEFVGEFNFDMLKALVEEMNRYKETVKEAIDFLNIDIGKSSSKSYDTLVTRNDIPLEVYQDQWSDPLKSDELRFDIRKSENETESQTGSPDIKPHSYGKSKFTIGRSNNHLTANSNHAIFYPGDERTHVNFDHSVITMVNDGGDRLVLTKQRIRNSFDFGKYL